MICHTQSCITIDAHAYVQAKLDEHPLFERISDKELEADPAADLLTSATEEGQKVARNLGEVNLTTDHPQVPHFQLDAF